MKTIHFLLLFFLLFTTSVLGTDTDSTTIKVHFLYGSKPAKGYKDVEYKWFGGILGGHVGIEFDSNRVSNFLPYRGFHIFGRRKKKNRRSAYTTQTVKGFWEIFGSPEDSVKKLTVEIPVSVHQQILLDSVMTQYTRDTPYDYAFIGMRCASSTYDLLAQIGIFKPLPIWRMTFKVFYPRPLRKRILHMAKKNNWYYTTQEGTKRRKWER